MSLPENLRYSKEHTWLLVEGTIGTIGITEFAQSQLGEIVYADLPNIGQHFDADEIFGSVEAIKTTSDLFMPVGGKVLETNEALLKRPELINSEPFTGGWMIKIEISGDIAAENLLAYSEYYKLIAE